MEAKLKEYRALRRRKELVENTKQKLEETKTRFYDKLVPSIFKMSQEKDEEVLLLENEELPEHLYEPDIPQNPPLFMPEDIASVTSEASEQESLEEEKQTWRYFTIKWTIYAVIWLTLYIFFLKLQFGAVFFVFSMLIGIYLNTRTQPKKEGEVSAYSVFNQNCVSIDGTLTAEQFEREIRFGPGSVR